MLIACGLRKGRVAPPRSKSHEHRLLVADFLAGDRTRLAPDDADPEDIKATKRCLAALAGENAEPVLDCGESGSTMRFLAPVAAALGKKATFVKKGRLAERPAIEYGTITPGTFTLPGNVSSQFATGLLFALPLLDGDSRIEFTSPLESRGYVDMTLAVLRGAGIEAVETPEGFVIPGRQKYRAQPGVEPETDWSGAAFWVCANAIGNEIKIENLPSGSLQPDARTAEAVRSLGGRIDVSQFPDAFPALATAAACTAAETVFTGTRRLRLKESDRAAAMAEMLASLGITAACGENVFSVRGTGGLLKPAKLRTFGDHRIAMSAAIAATRASGPVEIDDAACAAKSYPDFFRQFAALERKPR